MVRRTKKKLDLWALRIRSLINDYLREYGRSKQALAKLGERYAVRKEDRQRAETDEQALSRVIGGLMRQFRIHQFPLPRGQVLRKEESLRIPNGPEGEGLLAELRKEFGDETIIGLYRYEQEVIPGHTIKVAVYGREDEAVGRAVEPRIITIFSVIDSVSKQLDADVRTKLARRIGNKPVIKVEGRR